MRLHHDPSNYIIKFGLNHILELPAGTGEFGGEDEPQTIHQLRANQGDRVHHQPIWWADGVEEWQWCKLD